MCDTKYDDHVRRNKKAKQTHTLALYPQKPCLSLTRKCIIFEIATRTPRTRSSRFHSRFLFCCCCCCRPLAITLFFCTGLSRLVTAPSSLSLPSSSSSSNGPWVTERMNSCRLRGKSSGTPVMNPRPLFISEMVLGVRFCIGCLPDTNF